MSAVLSVCLAVFVFCSILVLSSCFCVSSPAPLIPLSPRSNDFRVSFCPFLSLLNWNLLLLSSWSKRCSKWLLQCWFVSLHCVYDLQNMLKINCATPVQLSKEYSFFKKKLLGICFEQWNVGNCPTLFNLSNRNKLCPKQKIPEPILVLMFISFTRWWCLSRFLYTDSRIVFQLLTVSEEKNEKYFQNAKFCIVAIVNIWVKLILNTLHAKI